MKIGTAFPSKYLKSDDLQGKEVKVEIDRCVTEDVTGDGEEKLIVYFRGKKKGLVLNKTNATKIAATYGDETDGWDGKPVILYPDTTQYQGRMVDCIRVRVPLETAGEDEKLPF